MGMAKTLKEAVLAAEDLELKVVYLVGLWLESVLYGMPILPIEEPRNQLIIVDLRRLRMPLCRSPPLLRQKQQSQQPFSNCYLHREPRYVHIHYSPPWSALICKHLSLTVRLILYFL
jgi:hypothetical protein